MADTQISITNSWITASNSRSGFPTDNINDNRDGTMSITTNDIDILGITGSIDNIIDYGTYSMIFTFTDIAQNNINNVNVQLYII